MLFLLLTIVPTAFAQKHEFAITAGGYIPSGLQTDVQTAPIIQGTYAHRIFGVPLASVYVEVPVARTFDVGLGALQGDYTATFVVPGVKLKLAPEFPASPYFMAGVGIAHISTNGVASGAEVDTSNTSIAVDFGGGVDFNVFPFVSLRGEIRNVNSGGLGFAIPFVSGRQNNIIATGGLVLRF
ncbi:MAG TPA: hypothetical protein VD837_14200 [Terriglobales bacterium]|nr:hypothetical protein [Terriglobales bacterium]